MKRIQTGVLLLCVSIIGVSELESQQSSAESANSSFHWSWRKAEELRADVHSLRNAKIPDAEKKRIWDAIMLELGPNAEEIEIETGSKIGKLAWDSRVKMTDLNGDGVPEVVAQSMADCSPVGNCSVWIFERSTAGYRMILKAFGQTFTIQPTKTNGYLDVVIGSHSSATEQGLLEYRYKNGRYRENACYIADWEILEGESIRQLKEPQINPYPCN